MSTLDVERPSADRLSTVFAALADPTRRAILGRLMTSDATVTELAEPFAMSQPAVSKHLRVLESAGLISRSKVATSRYSHLEAEPLREANDWMQTYKRFWNVSFDKLDVALAEYLESTALAANDNTPDRNTDEKTDEKETEK